MTWILVLTLTSSASYPGFAIQSVPGFRSLQDCLDAGNQWLGQMRAAPIHAARAICLSQKEAVK